MSKKNRSKNSNKKERKEYIYAATVNEVSNIIINHEKDGSFSFGQEMRNLRFEKIYDREKGEKIVSRIPQMGERLDFSVGRKLLQDYDFLCAIDTNTKKIGDNVISVIGIVLFKGRLRFLESDAVNWRATCPFCIELVNMNAEKIENICWMIALQKLHEAGLIDQGARIGMVVDSDLGKMQDFNDRKIPLFENFYLPEKIALLYASSDKKNDGIINKFISAADSFASQVIDALQDGKIPQNDEVVEGQYFDGIRIIHPKT